MSSRPRRTAARKASEAITDMADRDNMSSRTRRSADGKGFASVSRGPPSASGGDPANDHTYLTVKVPASKLRQATSSRQGNSISVNNEGSSTGSAKRATRGVNKSYVLESDSDDDEEEEGEDEIQVGAPAPNMNDDGDEEDEDMDDDLSDEDADGDVVEDEMDVDAEGEDEDLGDEDAEGEDDIDMDAAPPAPRPTIKISKPALKNSPAKAKSAPAPRKPAAKVIPPSKPITQYDDDDDDDELSELDSDDEDLEDTLQVGGMEDAEGEDDDEDMDAEGEEVDEEQEPETEAKFALANPGDLDSEDGTSRGETPDMSRMTVRQRARFEEIDPNQYQALSNDVQAKKVFTAEEMSMRRAEMARRRRNLSEKRNEEVKMETINKLLKKQAPKTKGRVLAGNADEMDDAGVHKPNPIFVRWTSSKEGSRIAVPNEMLEGPAGRVFVGGKPAGGGIGSRKMVEEVS